MCQEEKETTASTEVAVEPGGEQESGEQGKLEGTELEDEEQEHVDEAENSKVGNNSYLGNWEKNENSALCLTCIMLPCICMLANIELKLNKLKAAETLEEDEERETVQNRKRKRTYDPEEDQGEYQGNTPLKQCKASGLRRPLPLRLEGGGAHDGPEKGVTCAPLRVEMVVETPTRKSQKQIISV